MCNEHHGTIRPSEGGCQTACACVGLCEPVAKQVPQDQAIRGHIYCNKTVEMFLSPGKCLKAFC